MISLPALFLALSGTALLAALVAVFSSVRAAFGGGPGVVVETAHDLPDHAQLVDEKHALLRAIKDLEYERAVGKIGDADFHRLDAAYRARAKQVLEELDRDVKPLYDEAERLIESHGRARAGGDEGRGNKKKKAKAGKPVAAAESASAESAASTGSGVTPESDEAAPDETAHEVVIAGSGSVVEAGPSMDDVLVGIRDGSITSVPDAPAHWPADAKKMWSQTLTRALDDARSRARDENDEKKDA